MFRLLARRSFGSLTVTQFLGAFNDNAFKQVILLLVTLGLVPWVAEHPWARAWDQALPSALFALPFVLFGALTGSLADRVSKTSIIRLAKVLEIVVMSLALLAFQLRSYELLLAVLFLMGTQSALFGPSKYGSIPELLPESDLSRGNAMIQMTTMLAIILGTVVGGGLFDAFADALWVPALFYVGVATAGTLTALPIERLPAAAPGRPLHWNVPAEIVRHWRAMEGSRALILSVLASAFFYMVAAVLVQVVNRYGAWLELSGAGTSSLNAVIAVGVALGSVVAARLSGDRIESGLIPAGLGLLALSLPLVVLDPRSFRLIAAVLFLAGVSAGLFSVPVRALIQHLPRPERRGSVLGLSEVLDFTGIFLAAGLYFLLNGVLALSPPSMFLAIGVLVAAFLLIALSSTGDALVRLLLLGFVRAVYRLRVRGVEHLPATGALLVANHVSFVDALLIGAAAGRRVSFLMHRSLLRIPLVGWFATRMGAIPVAVEDERDTKEAALAAAAEAARAGALVCIFAEGAITRTGQLLPFRRGLERIAAPAGVPIVPLALDRLWGSVFSYERGRFFWKLPRRLPYPVDVVFGRPLPSDTPAWRARAAVAEELADLRSLRGGRRGSLFWRFVFGARVRSSRPALVEVAGGGRRELDYGRCLALVLALREVLRERLDGGPRVALLLPAGIDGVLANLAVCGCGKTAANLDPETGDDALEALLEHARIGRLVVPRPWLEAGRAARFGARALAIEDLLEEARRRARPPSAWLPASVLAARETPQRSAREVAVLVFPRARGGPAPGIELTHANVLSNVQALLELAPLAPGEAILSALPLHGAFGTTVGTWCPLLAGTTSVWPGESRDAAAVGALCRAERVRVLVAGVDAYRAWLGIDPADLATVRLAWVGGDELPEELARSWRERFGFELLAGYGRDELGPVATMGVPAAGRGAARQAGHKPGSVGRALPGVALRVVDPESGAWLAPGQEGRIEVKGPSVMRGYFERPDLTRSVVCGGWFATPDRGRIDDEGFLLLASDGAATVRVAPDAPERLHEG